MEGWCPFEHGEHVCLRIAEAAERDPELDDETAPLRVNGTSCLALMRALVGRLTPQRLPEWSKMGRDWAKQATCAALLAPGVALGHRRLSFIDLSGGHQLVSNEDESLWITFNGE